MLRPVGVDIQAYVGLGVIAVSMMLQLKYAPYIEPEIDRMELFGLMTSYGTLFFGLFLFSSNTPSTYRVACSVAIVAVNAAFLCWAVYMLRGVIIEARDLVVAKLSSKFSSAADPTPSNNSLSTEVEMIAVPPDMHTNRMFAHDVAESTTENEWQECQTEEGATFYYNRATKESSWTKPKDAFVVEEHLPRTQTRLSQL